MLRSTAPPREILRETFRDRCHVAVDLIVPWVLCLGHKLGAITQFHSQTVQYTLDTADVIVGLRVLAAARLGGLLNSLSMALTYDGVFVCNLLIKSVIEPSSSRTKLANCGMRDAGFVGELHRQPFRHLWHNTSLPTRERRSSCTHGAAIVVYEFLVVAVPCNNTLETELTIISSFSSGSVSVQAMVNPCLSALWDLDHRFHRCRWVHRSLECFALPRCLREG